MTREEILSATPEWLNEQAAKIMGVEKEFWNSVYNVRHAYELEEKVKESGLIEKYIYEFIDIVGFETIYYDGPIPTDKGMFQIAHATPEQRTKAFLLSTGPDN